MMWKILTAQIREEIYSSLISHELFSEEQKRCHQRIGYQRYIDQHILKERETRRKNVAMDLKKCSVDWKQKGI